MQITITLDPENRTEVLRSICFLEAVRLDGNLRPDAPVAATHSSGPPVLAAAQTFHAGPAPSAAPLAPEDNPAVFTAGAAAQPIAPEAAQVFSTSASASPVPVPVAPVAAVPPVPAAPTTSAPGVELDAEGLPWDARIHAKSSTGPGGVKNADGTWRAKRGVNDDALVAQVKAELRAAMGAPAAIPVPPVTSAVPIAVPPAAVPVPPVAAGPEEITTFPQIMKKISGLRVGQFPAMSQDELSSILAQAGLPSLPTLASRADLIPAVNAGIDALMLSKQH